MSDITHEQMLEALLDEKREADERHEEARRIAIAARENTERLAGAIAAIKALIPALEAAAATVTPAEPVAVVEAVEPLDEDEPTDRKRVPSTEWAAEIVIAAGRSMTREEVQEEFARLHGIPDGWADPVSSISVALKRASVKGLIAQTGRATYGPPERTTVTDSEELLMAE